MKTRQDYEDAAIGHGVAEDNCIGYSTQRQRFREGWDAAVQELTIWRDPKVELPEDGEVLALVNADFYKFDVMRYYHGMWFQKAIGGGWCSAACIPIGWRYIHEL